MSYLRNGTLTAIAERFGGLLAFALGAVTVLAFAPFGWFPLAILCPAGLFLLWESKTPREAARLGWRFGAGMFLSGLYWLYISLHVFGQAPLVIAVPLMLAVVAAMAAYIALLGYMAARFSPHSGPIRWLLTLPAGWVLIEWLRGWLLSGFPWLSLGYSQIDSPLAGIAPIAGVYGVSWAVAVSAGVVVVLSKAGPMARLNATVLLTLIWLGAGGLQARAWTQPDGVVTRVSIVQGAIAQDMKWKPEQFQPTLDLYRSLTEEHWVSDLVIWPEAAIPSFLHYVDVQRFVKDLWRDAAGTQTALLLGVPTIDLDTLDAFNSVISLDEDIQYYHKRHLVPFGEYFPVPGFVREWLRLMSLPHQDFESGRSNQPPLEIAGHKMAMTLCYEDAFGAEQLAILKDATMLVNLSNDAWFGDSIAPHQHLQIARMRALEAGRFLLRATNTGVSAIIGPDGKIVTRSPQFVASVLSGEVRPYVGLTPYAQVGNWLAIGGAALSLLLGVFLGRVRYA